MSPNIFNIISSNKSRDALAPKVIVGPQIAPGSAKSSYSSGIRMQRQLVVSAPEIQFREHLAVMKSIHVVLHHWSLCYPVSVHKLIGNS